jgi:hypothetical protein
LYIGYVGFGMGVVLIVCFIMSAVMSPILWAWLGESAISGAIAQGTPPAIGSPKSVGRAL